MVDDHTLNQIKEHIDIVDFISQYVTLKKRGQNFLGLCPFHNEKTSSFTVSPTKNIWHCFGCGEGGNVFKFLMKIDNLTFPESVKQLAEQSGIEIKEDFNPRHINKNTHIFEILESALSFYKDNLGNAKVKKYIGARGLTPEIVELFKLGYALDNKNSLYQFLKGEFPEEQLLESGLFIKTDRGVIDRFRDRLIFSIFDMQQRIIGFGGRTLGNDSAKYINSPETPVYTKGFHLYGLNATKRYINQANDSLIIVEGYMDALSLFQAGFKNVAAVLGTALTVPQVKLISRFASQVYLGFDSDSAGKKAVFKANDLFLTKETKVNVLDYRDCKDPDDFVKKHKNVGVEECIKEAMPIKRFLFYSICKQYSPMEKISSIQIEDKIRIIKEMQEILKDEEDLIKTEYVSEISKVLDLDSELVKTKFYSYKIFNLKQKRYEYKGKFNKYQKLENDVLSILLNDLNLRAEYISKFNLDNFEDEGLKKIYQIIAENLEKDLAILLSLETDISTKMTELSMRSYIENGKRYLDEAIITFKKKEKQKKIEFLNIEINRLEKTGDSDKLNLALIELRDLTKNK